jgi:hypothetical protein
MCLKLKNIIAIRVWVKSPSIPAIMVIIHKNYSIYINLRGECTCYLPLIGFRSNRA